MCSVLTSQLTAHSEGGGEISSHTAGLTPLTRGRHGGGGGGGGLYNHRTERSRDFVNKTSSVDIVYFVSNIGEYFLFRDL